jgi:hypothetical protein
VTKRRIAHASSPKEVLAPFDLEDRLAVTKMSPANGCLCSLMDRFHRYLGAQRLQAGDEALLDAGGVPLVEVVMAQLPISGAPLQDVVGDHEDTVAHGHRRLLLAPAPGEPMVLRRHIGPRVKLPLGVVCTPIESLVEGAGAGRPEDGGCGVGGIANYQGYAGIVMVGSHQMIG